MHFKVAVRIFHAFIQAGNSLTDVKGHALRVMLIDALRTSILCLFDCLVQLQSLILSKPLTICLFSLAVTWVTSLVQTSKLSCLQSKENTRNDMPQILPLLLYLNFVESLISITVPLCGICH